MVWQYVPNFKISLILREWIDESAPRGEIVDFHWLSFRDPYELLCYHILEVLDGMNM